MRVDPIARLIGQAGRRGLEDVLVLGARFKVARQAIFDVARRREGEVAAVAQVKGEVDQPRASQELGVEAEAAAAVQARTGTDQECLLGFAEGLVKRQQASFAFEREPAVDAEVGEESDALELIIPVPCGSRGQRGDVVVREKARVFRAGPQVSFRADDRRSDLGAGS